MSTIRKKYTKLPIDRKWIILALVIYIITFVFNIKIWPLLFLTIFCIANAILLSIDRYVSAPIDLELSTFSAVLLTTAYGLNWGIAVAILSKVTAIFYNKVIRHDHITMIIGYVIAAFVGNAFKGMPLLFLGVIVTIAVNIYTVFVSRYVTMLSNYEIIMYGISNTIFNIVLFIGFGDLFLKIML